MTNDEQRPLPEEYLEGIRLFNAGAWYDAHETWEAKWQQIGDSSADFYKGLIQIAVAALHWERGNAAGARKLLRSGCRHLRPFEPRFLRLDVSDFLKRVEAWFQPLFAAQAERRPAPGLHDSPPPRIVLLS